MKYFFVFILSIILILITTKTVSAAGANPFCLGASGQFSAFAWPGGTIDVACAGDTGSAGCSGHVVSLQPGQSYDFNNCTCSPWGMERDNGTTSPFSSGCIYIGRDLRLVQHANGNRTVEGDKSLPAGCSLNKPNPIACGANGQVISMPFTITCVPSPTPTRTPTLPPSVTPTQTPTVTPTRTPSPSPTRTPTPTITSTPSPTRTPSPTNTMTPTLTPTNTLTPTSTPPPSSCPVPEQVPNVRIDCPFCEL